MKIGPSPLRTFFWYFLKSFDLFNRTCKRFVGTKQYFDYNQFKRRLFQPDSDIKRFP